MVRKFIDGVKSDSFDTCRPGHGSTQDGERLGEGV